MGELAQLINDFIDQNYIIDLINKSLLLLSTIHHLRRWKIIITGSICFICVVLYNTENNVRIEADTDIKRSRTD